MGAANARHKSCDAKYVDRKGDDNAASDDDDVDDEDEDAKSEPAADVVPLVAALCRQRIASAVRRM